MKKKTITIGHKDDPRWSIIKGRVTKGAFNKAHKAEGWVGGGNQEVEYGFFRQTKRGFKKSQISDLKADVYTFIEW